MTNVD